MDLTLEDIEVLLEALPHWENQHITGMVMSKVIDAVLSKNMNETERAESKKNFDQETAQAEKAKAVRHERSVLIQAKLIMLKDRLGIDQLAK